MRTFYFVLIFLAFSGFLSAQNVVTNGDFGINALDPWTLTVKAKYNAAADADASSGKLVLDVTNQSTSNGSYYRAGIIIKQTGISVDATKSYVLRFRAKKTSVGTDDVNISFRYKDEGSTGYAEYSQYIALSDDWIDYGLNIPAFDAGVETISLLMYPGREAVYEVDDIVIEQGVITAVENLYDEEEIMIFPSLVNEAITIKSSQQVDAVNIYDIAGKIVMTADVSNKQVDVSSLPKGIYIVRMNVNGAVVSRKIQKL